MTTLRALYRCSLCGHVVEIVNEGAPTLVCCGKTMEKLEPKTKEEGKEKHVPIVEETKDGVIVKVGGIPHPMEAKHYIKFIEILTLDKVLRAELKPGQKPEADFLVKKSEIVEAREFCTIHGLWKN